MEYAQVHHLNFNNYKDMEFISKHLGKIVYIGFILLIEIIIISL